MGKKYLGHDKFKTLKYVMYMHTLIIDNEETYLLFLAKPTLEEQSHAKFTENKYSQLIISTITHDLKSPITIMQGNMQLLEGHVDDQGINYYNMLKISIHSFEYYIYDLIVFYGIYYRTSARYLRVLSHLQMNI